MENDMNIANINLLKQIAHGLSAQFGDNCEIVIHDLTGGNIESSIVFIENGHVTNRKLGDGPSHVVLEALHDESNKLEDHLGYLTRTTDGRILKSSTIYIRNEDQKVTHIFGINYDITNLLLVKSSLSALIDNNDTKEPEKITRNVTDLLDDLIDQSVKLVGKPVVLMTKEDKVKAIQFLNETGAFLITKSGDKVSKYFGISKYTLYSYMDINN
jgi:predicted transcriptional regulator YheO